jgi:ATP-dependent Clp protease ATP-binding subunit ClpC
VAAAYRGVGQSWSNFTDRSRKVLELAQRQAKRHGHPTVGPEHVLLGLIEEGKGVAANVLKQHLVTFEEMRSVVERLVPPGMDRSRTVTRPFAPQTDRAIEFACEDAQVLQHRYIGTEHLLLGILRDPDGIVTRVITHLGGSSKGLREEILELLGFKAK